MQAATPVLNLPGDTTIEASICDNETYEFNGSVLDQSGTYEVVLLASDGSDSTVTLILEVLPTAQSTVNATICDGETYSFNGQLLHGAGAYTAVLTAFNGCDSTVTLNLSVLPVSQTTINAAICEGETYPFGGFDLVNPGVYTQMLQAVNGCDSIVTLFLEVLPNPKTNLNVGICIGSFYTFNGDQLDQTGMYSAVFPSFNGCDSIVFLNLEVVPFFDIKLDESICSGDTYTFGDTVVALPGVYVDSLKAFGGCDSTVTLTLSVFPHLVTAVSANICAGETYIFGNDTLSAGGVFVDSLSTVNACDSVVTLTLSILPLAQSALSATICDNDVYDLNGETFSEAGVYTQVLTAFNGCDSTLTLTLNVLPTVTNGIEATICDGDTYDFNGDILTNAGVYTQVYPTFYGCDSTVMLMLDVLPLQSTNLAINICEGETYMFDGLALAAAGTYTAVYTGVNGCDSTVTLNLGVLPVFTTALEATICDGEVYPFNGQALSNAGVYTAILPAFNGCDSTVTLTLMVLPSAATALEATICANETYDFNGETYNQTGTYTAVLPAFNGCDSTITLNLTVLPVTQTNLALNLCEGVSYDFNGQTLTQDGIYTVVLTAFNGCDSTVTLQLDFVPFFADFIITSICQGESFAFGNQDITQSGQYVLNLFAMGGCDSTVTLILTVNPVAVTNLNVSICNGETYSFDGVELDQSGSYNTVLQTVAGCDSTVNLTLTVLPNSVSSVEVSICDGDVYAFNGLNLSDAGTYNASITSFNGCDSTITLTLNVLPLAATTLAASICNGETFDFNGTALTLAGTYTEVLTALNGCDSTVTLLLNVLPLTSSQLTAQICEGDTYTFNGQALEQSGTYAAVFTGFNGCDSTVTLVLTVATELAIEFDAAICEGETYSFDGTDLDTEGSYTFVYTAQGGCDSTVTLNLSVFPNLTTNLDATLCAGDTYPFNGQLLDQSGDYTAVLTSVNGCDSTVNLALTVLPAISSEFSASTCNGDPYNYAGTVLNQSGSYQFTLTAANGCDSMVTVNLTIYQDVPPTVINAAICQGESYNFFGQNLTNSGAYTKILETAAGCDSIIGLLLTVLPNPATALNQSLCQGDSTFFNGNYVAAPGVYTATYPAFNGCDSIVTLTLLVTPVDNGVTLSGNTLTSTAQNAEYLWINCSTGFPVPGATGQSFTPEATGSYAVFVTQNGCSRLSNCIQVIGTATNEPENGIVWQLSPNPAVSETNIRFEEPLRNDCTIDLVDASGKILSTENVSQGATFVTLELTNMPDGILFVRLNDGQNVVVKRLIKN